MSNTDVILDDVVFFRFEADFVEAGVRCIPMIVRYKLDACGIKLKLSEWSRMTEDERMYLANAPCAEEEEVRRYREYLYRLIASQAGEAPTLIPVEQSPAWSRLDEIPYTIRERIQEISGALTLERWQCLTALQRFALLKLSYSGHEHKNFRKALTEFGLAH